LQPRNKIPVHDARGGRVEILLEDGEGVLGPHHVTQLITGIPELAAAAATTIAAAAAITPTAAAIAPAAAVSAGSPAAAVSAATAVTSIPAATTSAIATGPPASATAMKDLKSY
jgi:hypothetical protein